MKLRIVFLSVLVALFAWLLTGGRASAHADLVEAHPAPNAALEKSPVQIELYFSEPVDGTFTTIQVLDAAGMRVDNDDSGVDAANPIRAAVTVRSLPDGVYTVSWRALSLVDSHITSGAYPFAVGDVEAAELAAAASASQRINISAGEIIFRWLSYLSSGLLLGGALFRTFVWIPAAKAERLETLARVRKSWRILAITAVGALAAASLIGLVSQSGQVIGQGAAAPWNPAMGRLLFTTWYGFLWLVRFGLGLVVAASLRPEARPGNRWVIAAAGAGVLVTFSLNSHAAAEPEPFLPVLGDFVHAVGAAAWIGGLVFFSASLYSLRDVSEGIGHG